MSKRPGGLPDARVLITGGSGFVGQHLLPLLHERTAGEIVLAGREPEAGVALDLTNPASVAAAVRAVRPSLVIHLAGEASVASAAQAATAAWQVNFSGTLALASAMAGHCPDATLLFASSAEIYGLAFLDGPVDEQCRPAPQSVYAQSKLAAEQMLAAVLGPQAQLIVCRPSNHVGPGQNERFALPSFAQQIAAGERAGGETLIRVGNLEAERDFMDVRDVVRAYVALLGLPRRPGARDIYNVSSQAPRAVRSLLDMLRGLATIRTEVEIDPDRYRPNEIPRAVVDSTRLRDATGWAPLIPIERTMADILDSARGRL